MNTQSLDKNSLKVQLFGSVLIGLILVSLYISQMDRYSYTFNGLIGSLVGLGCGLLLIATKDTLLPKIQAVPSSQNRFVNYTLMVGAILLLTIIEAYIGDALRSFITTLLITLNFGYGILLLQQVRKA